MLLDDLQQRLRQHEGAIPFMYLDTLGYVTAAVGHLLATPHDAVKLPFLKPDGTLATDQEKITEWWTVHSLEKAHLPQYYEVRTTLRLAPQVLEDTLKADILANSPARMIPGFGSFPDPAQEALLDMSFQLGATGLVKGFPHLMHSVTERDWATCATQCERQGIQAWRNAATSALFLQAAHPTAA